MQLWWNRARDLFGKPATFFILELCNQLSSVDSMNFQNYFSKDFKTESITHSAFLIGLNQREESFSEGLKTEKLHPIDFGEK